ncbi:hypothetical protein TCAL_05606 [Tigriopus californicus]|uniref:RCC1-like domain-containing protein n=1 Tax=Tigriopus californicus TaxID=6832 RepID=A0A553NB24_TIGCA|nr:hypothetical protein TCAL_05606 [Tigriopus californicus]
MPKIGSDMALAGQGDSLKGHALWAWGANNYGQLGLGCTFEQCETPTQVGVEWPTDVRVAKMAGGGGHTFALATDGSLWGTGWNNKGQLGLPDRQDRHCFSRIIMEAPLQDIGCGWDFSLALTVDGQVLGCGSNAFGQLGLTPKMITRFTVIPTLSSIIAVAAGMRHSIFLHRNGSVLGCGSNRKGQLSRVEPASIPYPEPLATHLPPVSQIYAGQNHSVFNTSDGVYGCGDNKHGQLGHRTTDQSPRVFQITPECYAKLSLGWTHVLALKEDHSLHTWGRNTYEQLGRSFEASLAILSNVEDISAGYEHNLALTTDGELLAWGWNEHGNCGDGSVQNVPRAKTINSYKPRLKR